MKRATALINMKGLPGHPSRAHKKNIGMNKKIMLLALGAISVVMLAVPAMSSALMPLHLSAVPTGSQAIDSLEEAKLSSSGSGFTVICSGLKGSAAFNSTTGGTVNLTLVNSCKGPLGGLCTNDGMGSITTTTLPFQLATVEGGAGTASLGILITPDENTHFATFFCHVLGVTFEYVLKGNGLIGTVTSPACNGKTREATLTFETLTHGWQKDKQLMGTSTEYGLNTGTEMAALSGRSKITFTNEPTWICT